MTAPAGVARFDCDPITCNSLGLLIEESRTNLLTYSSDFSNSVWSKASIAVSSDAIIAPDGTLTGDIFTTATASHNISQQLTVTASTSYTFSWYAKLSTMTPKYSVYSITGSAYIIAPSLYPTGTSVGNGWFRYSATFTTPVGCVTARVYPLRDSIATGDIFIWGAQVEAGAFSTSYIPTVASTVTRAAEDVNMTGVNAISCVNLDQGTIFVDVSDFAANNNAFSFKSTGYQLSMFPRGLTNVGVYTLPPGAATNVVVGSILPQKTAVTYNGLTTEYAVAGVSRAGVTTGAHPTTSALTLTVGVGSGYLNGHIRKLSYYPVALSSSNLVALTS
jgi:hypothetical protein